MKIRSSVLAVVLLAPALTVHAQAPPPQDLAFGRALGFAIEATLAQAHANARARGEDLLCRSADVPELPDAGSCQPEGRLPRPTPPDVESIALLLTLPSRPAYRLLLDGDTVGAIVLNLENFPELSRRIVEAHWDARGVRAVEGASSTQGSRSENIFWVHPGGRDYVWMECRTIESQELCNLMIGRAETPDMLQRSLEMWRRLFPLPLYSSESPA